MVFEQLIGDAVFTSAQKNLIYQIEDFNKKLPKYKKLIYREFLNMGVFNYYAKLYAHFSYNHLTEAISKIDLKTKYDLKKLSNCISKNVVNFLKRDLLTQLTENHFKISEYKNNLIEPKIDYKTVPGNFRNVVKTCLDYYKNNILEDRKNNKVKELSGELNKNKKILNSYSPIIQKLFNEFEKALHKKDYYELEIYGHELAIETAKANMKDPKNYSKLLNEEELKPIVEKYNEAQKRIAELEQKISLLQPHAQKYGKIHDEYKGKLDEIYAENQVFMKKQKDLVAEQKEVINNKATNKKMYRLLSELNRKMVFHPKASKDLSQ